MSEWLKSNIYNCIKYVFIAMILIFAFGIFYYSDFSDTLDNSVLLAKCIKNGQLTHYYEFASNNAHKNTVYTANYNVFVYFIFMIWNFPIILMHFFTKFDYMYSRFALLWCKSIIFVSIIFTSIILKKIIAAYVSDKKIQNYAQTLFLIGSCVVIPAFVACQYDILSIMCIMMGIYGFIKKKNALFFISFILGIPMKTFALFIFIPLLLIKEKRIPFIILSCLLVCSIEFICKIPFLSDPWYRICVGTQNRDAINLILSSCINVGSIKINLFILCFIAICVYAYKMKIDEKNTTYKAIYITSMAMLSFIVFSPIRSYWIILSVPFLIMLAVYNRKNFRINILLYIIGTACYSVYALMTHMIYSYGGAISKLLLKTLMENQKKTELKFGSIQGLFDYYELTKYSTILFSVFVIAVVLLVILNFPKCDSDKEEKCVCEKWLEMLQIVITGSLLALIVYANLAQSGKYVFNTYTENKDYYSENIFECEGISQSFRVYEDDKISEIRFTVSNRSSLRLVRNSIKIVIKENDNIKMEEIVGVAELIDKKEYVLKFKEIELNKDNEYTIEITPIKMRDELNDVHFEMTNDMIFPEYPLYVNDEPKDGNLVIKIR